MSGEQVDSNWFIATFPAKVEVTEDHSEPRAPVVDYVAFIEPFGIFSIRVTNITIDLFVAIGASQWVARSGDQIIARFKEWNAQVVEDRIRDPVPGLKVRDLTFRFEHEGTRGCFGRVMGITDGDCGRILEATALVDWSPQWEERANAFLDSIHPSVSRPSWKPEA